MNEKIMIKLLKEVNDIESLLIIIKNKLNNQNKEYPLDIANKLASFILKIFTIV